MTQQQLIEGAAPPRPKRKSFTIIDAVAHKLLPEVVEWLAKDHDGDDARVIEDIKEALNDEWDWDGYKLVRALRDWEGDSRLVEIMDGAECAAGDAHRAEVKAWVQAFDIKPEFAVGSAVRFTDRDGTHDGEVATVYAEEATYSVFVEALGHIRPDSSKCGTLGIIKPFEEVTAREPS